MAETFFEQKLTKSGRMKVVETMGAEINNFEVTRDEQLRVENYADLQNVRRSHFPKKKQKLMGSLCFFYTFEFKCVKKHATKPANANAVHFANVHNFPLLTTPLSAFQRS